VIHKKYVSMRSGVNLIIFFEQIYIFGKLDISLTVFSNSSEMVELRVTLT